MDDLTLRRRVRGSPEDPEGWVALAHFARRTGRHPEFLRSQDLPWVIRAWRRFPKQRDLGLLLTAATHLTPVARELGQLGRHWGPGQRRGRDGLYRDRRSGLPLAVLHEPSGVELRWVPVSSALGTEASMSLAGAYVGRFPVTVEQYQRYLAATNGTPPGDYQARNPWKLQRHRPVRPAVFVSQPEADAFAGWAGGSLPSASWWRWAARGPSRGKFPWGRPEPKPEHARWNYGIPWRGGDWDRFLEEVDARPGGVGTFGLEGMAGNVWEWTTTRCRRDGSIDPEVSGWHYLLLGGGWGTSRPEELEVDFRGRALDRHERCDDVGFRLFLPLPCATIGSEIADLSSERRRAKRARRRRRRRQRRRAR